MVGDNSRDRNHVHKDVDVTRSKRFLFHRRGFKFDSYIQELNLKHVSDFESCHNLVDDIGRNQKFSSRMSSKYKKVKDSKEEKVPVQEISVSNYRTVYSDGERQKHVCYKVYIHNIKKLVNILWISSSSPG